MSDDQPLFDWTVAGVLQGDPDWAGLAAAPPKGSKRYKQMLALSRKVSALSETMKPSIDPLGDLLTLLHSVLGVNGRIIPAVPDLAQRWNKDDPLNKSLAPLADLSQAISIRLDRVLEPDRYEDWSEAIRSIFLQPHDTLPVAYHRPIEYHVDLKSFRRARASFLVVRQSGLSHDARASVLAAISAAILQALHDLDRFLFADLNAQTFCFMIDYEDPLKFRYRTY